MIFMVLKLADSAESIFLCYVAEAALTSLSTSQESKKMLGKSMGFMLASLKSF